MRIKLRLIGIRLNETKCNFVAITMPGPIPVRSVEALKMLLRVSLEQASSLLPESVSSLCFTVGVLHNHMKQDSFR